MTIFQNNEATPSSELPMEALLRALFCFEQAGDEMIRQISTFTDVIDYQPGDSIISMGGYDGSVLYGLVKGEGRLTKAVAASGVLDMSDLHAGQMIGLSQVFAQEGATPITLSLVATTEVTVVTIEAKALLSLVKEDIAVTHHLLQFFAQEMMRYEAPQDHQIHPERRVYRHFLTLAEKKGKNFVIPQMPKHAVISEACGVTDQDVAKAVAYLIAENIIEREYPRLIIRDISALRALSY